LNSLSNANPAGGLATLEAVTPRLLTDSPEQEQQAFIEIRRLPGGEESTVDNRR